MSLLSLLETPEPTSDFVVPQMGTRNQGVAGERHIKGKPCRKCGSEIRLISNGRCVACQKATVAKWRAENTERTKGTDAKWRAENTERTKVSGAKWHAASRLKGLQILGACCQWSDLAGCEGDLEVDHIIPPGLRRKAGYTSAGSQLIQWILANPALAQVRLQLLCNEHNRFKSDKPNHEARAEWAIKHPITWRLFK